MSTPPLSATHPDLCKYLYQGNEDQSDPDILTAGSNLRVWWICANNTSHVFRQSVCDRIRSDKSSNRGCGYCAGKLVSPERSLKTLHPEVAESFHKTKNGNFTAADFTAKSNKKLWWFCSICSNEWEAKVSNRTLGAGCPFCVGKRPTTTNCLQFSHPNIAKQLHPLKNNGLLASQIMPYSNKVLWWLCPVDPTHEWQAKVQDRTQDNSGCPFCSGHRVSRTNSLGHVFPAIAAMWHPSRNGALTPADVTKSSMKVAWWQCDRNHQWQNTINAQTHGSGGCPACISEKRRASALALDLARKEKSAAQMDRNRANSIAVRLPALAAQLHPTMNAGLRAENLTCGSSKWCYWQCPSNSEHVWRATVSNRVAGTGCPWCKHRKVDVKDSLLTLRPELAAEWSYEKNETLGPEQVSLGSNRNVWWRCKRDSQHVWQAKVHVRVAGHKTCPYCSGWFVTDKNRLSILFPDVASEFHRRKNRWLYPEFASNAYLYPKNRRIAPEDLPKKNRRLRASDLAFDTCANVTWFCSKNPLHPDWVARVYSRTVGGQGCPTCSHHRPGVDTNLAFAFPSLAKRFHLSRNAPVQPSMLVPGSDRVFWWKCGRFAHHVFRARVKSMVRSYKSGSSGCPYCEHRIVEEATSLAKRFPTVARMMLYTVPDRLSAKQISAFSKRKAVFQCDKSDDHSWIAIVGNVTRSFVTSGRTGCPYCYHKVTIATSIATTFPQVVRFIDRAADSSVKPNKLSSCSHRIVPFRCYVCKDHRWSEEVRAAVKRFKKHGVCCKYCVAERLAPETH